MSLKKLFQNKDKFQNNGNVRYCFPNLINSAFLRESAVQLFSLDLIAGFTPSIELEFDQIK